MASFGSMLFHARVTAKVLRNVEPAFFVSGGAGILQKPGTMARPESLRPVQGRRQF